MIGRSLSHFEILEKLGEGGMGIVYKARDLKLDRTVAVKVLASDKVGDEDRRRRFIQEAKAASALNHPNIVTIHEISQESGSDFIVMEFVPGKTLDQLIPRRGLRLSETLRYAVQIAEGLAKAHAAGIVHRDLKPSNVIVSTDGRVKILDFGLAKLIEQPVISPEGATVTVTQAYTEEGTILGTVAYMSPEQAQGLAVDHRSDIFSFGSVLYEMVTGLRAFQGPTRIATLSSVIRDEPQRASNIPRELERLIARCLRKDPERRAQSMVDVKLELEELREESESGALAGSSPRPPASKPSWAWPAAFALTVLAGAGYWLRRPPQLTPVEPLITQLTRDPGLTFQPALSPDGKLLAYASDRGDQYHMDIWIQQMAGGQPVRLTSGPADKMFPCFSADGTKILFSHYGDNTVSAVPALGGDVMTLIRGQTYEAQYSPDGSEVAAVAPTAAGERLPLYIFTPSTGARREVQTGFRRTYFKAWSPDGRNLLIRDRDNSNLSVFGETGELYVVSREGGKPTSTGVVQTLLRSNVTLSNIAWLSDRLIAGGRAGEVGVIEEFRLKKDTWQLNGPPRRLLAIPGAQVNVTARDSGPIVFSSVTTTEDIWSLPLDDTGRVLGPAQKLTNDAAHDRAPSISSDGKRMVFVTDRTGTPEIWLRDLASGKETQLTASPENEIRARISPDGNWVAYEVQGKPGYILARQIDAQEPRTVCRECSNPHWSPDSERVSYYTGSPLRYETYNLRSGERVVVLQHPKRAVQNMRFSPDGGWISFHLPGEGGFAQIFIARLNNGKATPEGEWIPITTSNKRDYHTWWSPKGNQLYFLHDTGNEFEVVAQQLHPLSKRPQGAPIPIFKPKSGQQFSPPAVVGLSISRDRLVFAMEESRGNLWKLERERNVP